jgi:hypothetical protein
MNHLYQRRGEERLRADAAACAPSREAHMDLSDRYGTLIREAKATEAAPEPLRVDAPAD